MMDDAPAVAAFYRKTAKQIREIPCGAGRPRFVFELRDLAVRFGSVGSASWPRQDGTETLELRARSVDRDAIVYGLSSGLE